MTAIATEEEGPEEGRAEWLTTRERGTMLGFRAALLVLRLLGRRVTRGLAAMIAFYYTVFSRRVREVLREFHTRVTGETPGFWGVYRHVRTFAHVVLDRFLLSVRHEKLFEIERTGNHHLVELTESGRGALLMGSHVGSYDAMRLSAQQERFRVHILGYFENARMVNSLLEELNPGHAERVIALEPGNAKQMLKVKELIESGDVVAMAADRVGLNDKTIEVEFFGRKAAFPTGPWILASVLRCPVYLTFGLYSPPNRYHLFCEPFVERVVLPRKRRQEALRELVERYAARLEEFVRRSPNNWFNFYDYWALPEGEAQRSQGSATSYTRTSSNEPT